MGSIKTVHSYTELRSQSRTRANHCKVAAQSTFRPYSRDPNLKRTTVRPPRLEPSIGFGTAERSATDVGTLKVSSRFRLHCIGYLDQNGFR